jgi:hypothetical protein
MNVGCLPQGASTSFRARGRGPAAVGLDDRDGRRWRAVRGEGADLGRCLVEVGLEPADPQQVLARRDDGGLLLVVYPDVPLRVEGEAGALISNASATRTLAAVGATADPPRGVLLASTSRQVHSGSTAAPPPAWQERVTTATDGYRCAARSYCSTVSPRAASAGRRRPARRRQPAVPFRLTAPRPTRGQSHLGAAGRADRVGEASASVRRAGCPGAATTSSLCSGGVRRPLTVLLAWPPVGDETRRRWPRGPQTRGPNVSPNSSSAPICVPTARQRS